MIITQNINPFIEQTTYDIKIEQNDDLNASEIAECFVKQYPKNMAVVSFAKIIKMELGMIIIGLNLKGIVNSKSKVKGK